MTKWKVRITVLDDYHGAATQPHITLGSAVRLRCLDCCGNQRAEVAKCPAYECPLWSYRMGLKFEPVPDSAWACTHEVNPEPSKATMSGLVEREALTPG